MRVNFRLAAGILSGVCLTAAACSPPQLVDTSPRSGPGVTREELEMVTTPTPPAQVETALLGAPNVPARPAQPTAAPPAPPTPQQTFFAMAPIPNPTSPTPRTNTAVAPRIAAARPAPVVRAPAPKVMAAAPAPRPASRPVAAPTPKPTVIAAAPAPKPIPTPAPRPVVVAAAPAPKPAPAPTPKSAPKAVAVAAAPVAKPAPKPIVVAAAPAPRAMVAAPKPAPAPEPKPEPKPPVIAPVIAAIPESKPEPKPEPVIEQPKKAPPKNAIAYDASRRGPVLAPQAAAGSALAQLGKRLLPEVQAGAKLDVPKGLPNGYQAVVTVSLPANLPARVQEEARRLGVDGDAGIADLRVALKGAGYIISPTGHQAARLSPDQAPKMSWVVSEGADTTVAKEPLRAEISVEMKSGGRTLSVPLGVVATVPAALSQADEAADKGDTPFSLPFNSFALTIPLVLMLIAIFILARWARTRRLEKERRHAHLEQFHT